MKCINKTPFIFILCTLAFLLSSCKSILVQPYDEKLITDTETLFKKASEMIDDGIANSPVTDETRKAILRPSDHPGHFSKFKSRYESLDTDANALILRAMSKSENIDKVGESLQEKVNELIDKSLPSQCSSLESDLGINSNSLTVKNYIDLKCIIVNWKAQHSNTDAYQDSNNITDGTQILKRANWELRKSTIFTATLAIQRAEMSKKH